MGIVCAEDCIYIYKVIADISLLKEIEQKRKQFKAIQMKHNLLVQL